MKKEVLFISAIILGLFAFSCNKTDTPNQIDISLLIGSWIDTTTIKTFNIDGSIEIKKLNGIYNFYADSSYTTENIKLPINGVIYNGKWNYKEDSQLLSFKPYDNILDSFNLRDIYLNKTWKINELDNSNLEVNFRVFREQKIVVNPITGLSDTIKPIDITMYKKLHKID